MSEVSVAETLHEYELMVDRLLRQSSKNAMARALRVLASYVSHYQLRYGVSAEVDLVRARTVQPASDQVVVQAEVLRVLAAALTVAAVSEIPADA